MLFTLVDTQAGDNYGSHMIELITSRTFDGWLRALRDRQAKARILARLDRLAAGNPGDVKPIGGGLSEMRIDHGPGYRVYYVQRGPLIVILLSGGDKSSQQSDIARAREIAAQWKD